MRPADEKDSGDGNEAGGRGFRRDVDAIRDDLNLLKSDLAAAMRDLINVGREGGGDARERLERVVQERLDAINERAEELSQQGRNALEDVERRAREHPLQALAIAFGAGFLVGAVLTRR